MPNSPSYVPRAPALRAGRALLTLISILLVEPRRPGPPPAAASAAVARPTSDAAELLLFRKLAAGGVERLHDGAIAGVGDLVQPAYLAPAEVHGVVVSFDGVGVVTLHYPDENHESTLLAPRGVTPLDHSFELDDAPHFERFVLVTTRGPSIDLGRVLQAATLLARMGRIATHQPLALPPGYGQTSVVLLKKSPR